jgi:adhesin transport system membrane fusion protein
MSLVQAENAAAIARSDLAASAASIARAQSAVTEARSTLVQQRQDWRSRAAQELASAQAEMVGLRRALPALSARVDRTIVRSPVSGRVNRVMVTTVGGTISPGAPLAEIVPSEESLLIEVLIRPSDIAWVRLNQPAKINVSAYDSSIYGSLHGKVISISPDATLNERTGESFYTLRVAANDKLADRNGTELTIGPGMIADVSLLGDKRSILNYILAPISRIRDTALREQ